MVEDFILLLSFPPKVAADLKIVTSGPAVFGTFYVRALRFSLVQLFE